MSVKINDNDLTVAGSVIIDSAVINIESLDFMPNNFIFDPIINNISNNENFIINIINND